MLKFFFLFFICGGHVDSFNFCFTTKVQLYYEKLLKTHQSGYTLMSSCCTEADVPLCMARLGPGVLYKQASRATLYGATDPGLPELRGHVARLGQDHLS
jgi:hypothetical protein